MTELPIDVLGEALGAALERLAERGVRDVCVQHTQPPRKPEQTGNLRVVRAKDGGRFLVTARFPDEVERDS